LLGARSADDRPCYLGSVKANIGHAETVSGLAGVVKVALMLQHRLLFPQPHFRKLNRRIALDGQRLAISERGQDWPDREGRRLAARSRLYLRPA